MEKIGRFEIVGKLGRGAFGMVYKGRDPVINRMAAIKVMSEATVGDPELVARFKREAEAAGGLNHRNIVTIYDLGEHGGLPYIAMEFLEGHDLEKLLKDKTEVAVDSWVDIMIQTAEGLHYAHEKGIIHRDIKPANIRLLADGTVKLMDFGIAKMSSSDMTRTGQFMGTVNYMSPEQIKAKKIDGRSDLFAAGIMFYEMLSRRRPFPGDSITAVIYKIVNETPPPLAELHGTDHEWLEGVVFRCLEKEPEKRWQNCQEFANALKDQKRVAAGVAISPIDQTISIAQAKAAEGDIDSALAHLDQILEQDPDNTTVLRSRRSIEALRVVKQAESLISSGRLEQARDQLLKAMAQFEGSPEINRTLAAVEEQLRSSRSNAMLEEARRNLAGKRYEAAIDQLKQALELDPYNEEVKATLRRTQDEKRADDVDDLIAEAKALIERRQLQQALESVRRALELDPQSRTAKTLSQQVERDLKLTQTSSAVEDALIEARLALKRRDFTAAVSKAEQVLALDPRNSDAKQIVADAKHGQVSDEQSEQFAELMRRGTLGLKKKKFDDALKLFENAAKLDPKSQEARLGIVAATKRRTSIEAAGTTNLTPVLAAVGAAVVVIGAIVGFFLTRPTAARLKIDAADAAVVAGGLEDGYRQYLEAADPAQTAKGKDTERAEAKLKVEALAAKFEVAGAPLRALDVLADVARWKGADSVKPRYRDLALKLAKAGAEANDIDLHRGAAAAFKAYFALGYSSEADFDLLKSYAKVADQVLVGARQAATPIDGRLELYEQVQEILNFADNKEPGLGLFTVAASVRVERTALLDKSELVKSFESNLRGLHKRASEGVTAGALQDSINAYGEIVALVDQNAKALEGVKDVASDREKAVTARANLQSRLESEEKGATLESLRLRAKQNRDAGNLEAELRVWERVLTEDPNDAEGRQRQAELDAVIKRVEALDRDLVATLDRRDAVASAAGIAELERLNPGNPRIAVLRSRLDELQATTQEAVRVSTLFAQGDALFGNGDLDKAEAQYREILTSSSTQSVIEQATAKIQQILDQRSEAKITAIIAAADAVADPKGRLEKLREAERLSKNFPGLSKRISDAQTAIYASDIAAAEKGLQGALESFNGSRDVTVLLKAEAALRNIPGGDSSRVMSQVHGQALKLLEGDLRTAFDQHKANPAGFDAAKAKLLKLDPGNALPGRLGQQLADASATAADAAQAATDRDKLVQRRAGDLKNALAALDAYDLDRARGLTNPHQDQADAAPVLARLDQLQGKLTEARPLLAAAKAELDRAPACDRALISTKAAAAAAVWPPFATEETSLNGRAAQACKADDWDEIAELANGKKWGSAAKRLETYVQGGGTPRDKQVAARVFLTASYLAACRANPCNLELAKQYGGQAAILPDVLTGRVTNAKWADTVGQFSNCADVNLKGLCQAVGKELL